MAFKVPERLYRTEEGRLVRHDDPAAAFLAFPAGHELSDDEARRLGVLAFFGLDKTPEKMVAAPQNKMANRPADKSGAATTSKESTT